MFLNIVNSLTNNNLLFEIDDDTTIIELNDIILNELGVFISEITMIYNKTKIEINDDYCDEVFVDYANIYIYPVMKSGLFNRDVDGYSYVNIMENVERINDMEYEMKKKRRLYRKLKIIEKNEKSKYLEFERKMSEITMNNENIQTKSKMENILENIKKIKNK